MKQRLFSILNCLFILGLILLFTQCIPSKQINYLQNVEPSTYKPLDGITDKYFLQPNDYLFIQVSSMDPKLSSFFNLNSVSASSSSSSTANSRTNFYYMIDDSMRIDFPYIGLINLKGCNLKMAKHKIQDALNPFLKEAIINVQLGLCQFIIVGEVKSEGPHQMLRDQITIFDAIGQAGITEYGKRKDIKLVRHYPNETKTFTIDLTDAKIIDSEYYYIYPNDLIYVRPMYAKKFGLGETMNLSFITAILALYLTVYTIAKN